MSLSFRERDGNSNSLFQLFYQNGQGVGDNTNTVHYISPASTPHSYAFEGDVCEYGGRGSSAGKGSARSAASSEASKAPAKFEYTLALIKPAAMEYKDVVLRKIREANFDIIQQKLIHLTPEQASELYAHHYGSASFPLLVLKTSEAPLLALCLAGPGAVQRWKELVEPDNGISQEWFWPRAMRLRFGVRCGIKEVLHASENAHQAEREVRYFFPDIVQHPVMSDETDIVDYLNYYVNPTLLNGLTELCKKKPADPLIFLAEWLLLNDPYQPRMNPDIATLPT